MEINKFEQQKTFLVFHFNHGAFKKADKKSKEFRKFIIEEAKKRNKDCYELIDYFAGHKEELLKLLKKRSNSLKAMVAFIYNQGAKFKEYKEIRNSIKKEAKKRNVDAYEFIDSFADDKELANFLTEIDKKTKEKLIKNLPAIIPFYEAYKLHLHEGINKVSSNIQKIKNYGILDKDKNILELKFGNNEYVRFAFKKDDNYESLTRSGSVVSKTFDFILWKIGTTQKCFFSCDLNDYFDFVGTKRRHDSIKQLSDILSFLSNCDFHFKTTIKNKITNKMEKVSGYGRAFAWSLVKHDLENPKSKYKTLEIGTTPTWAKSIINNKFFTKIDHKLPKISSEKYPYAYHIGKKLHLRYRNNATKRRGEETESISVQILIDVMNLSEKIKARGYPRQISQLEKSLNKLADDKIIKWRYKKRYKKAKDKAFGMIIYKPLSEDILSINKSSFIK